MKKVMVGVLVVIPIVILLIVAAVTRIVSVQAWVAVESVSVEFKDGSDELTLNFSDLGSKPHYFGEYLNVSVLPERANRYTVEWRITDAVCTDPDYKERYDDYLANKHLNEDDDPDNDVEVVYPAVMLIDANGEETSSNTTGFFVVNSYCNFTVIVQAEHVSDVFNASVVDQFVESITLQNEKGDGEITVGDSILLGATCIPLNSVLSNAEWRSSNEGVATVDENGVVTARSAGSCEITLTTVREDEVSVTSAPYAITVVAGASDIFGDKVVTSKRQVTFEEIGVDPNEVEEFVHCTREGGILTLEEGAVLTLKNEKQLSFESCDDEGVKIANAELFDSANGNVLAVGDLPIKLSVDYADMLKAGAPASAVWTSSSEEIATVDDGLVTPVGNGIVTISARVGDNVAAIELNVRTKVAFMRLITSESALAVGIARETVFGSERYADISQGTEVLDNFFDIRVQGEPKTAGESGTLEDALRLFYDAYEFSVDDGSKEFAYFSKEKENRIYFNSAAFVGKPMQHIVVKVSAKYPKYKSMTMFTEETVTLNVTYGASVSSLDEYLAAAEKAYDYAHEDGNYVPEQVLTRVHNDYIAADVVAVKADESHSVYSIALDGDILFPNEYGDDQTLHKRNYGNVYGNNHMMHKEKSYNISDFGLINLAANNLVASNVVIRLNDHGDDDVVSGEEAKAFNGAGVTVCSDDLKHIVSNAKVEYIIIENGKHAARLTGCEVTLDGCIMRNMSACSVYAPARLWDFDDGSSVYIYTQLTAHNNVCSNSLGTYMSFGSEAVLYTRGTTPRFASNDADNIAFLRDNFLSKGFGPYFHQTGFLDIYNWQKASDGKLIDVGDDTYNDLIASLAAPMMAMNDAFKPGRVMYNDELYVHMGFVISGILFDYGILKEPNLADVQMEDDSFYCIESQKMVATTDDDQETFAVSMLQLFDLKFYGYKSTSRIQPGDVYELNIDRLHQR